MQQYDITKMNKQFETQVHHVGCTIRIYYDARTYERQTIL